MFVISTKYEKTILGSQLHVSEFVSLLWGSPDELITECSRVQQLKDENDCYSMEVQFKFIFVLPTSYYNSYYRELMEKRTELSISNCTR